MLFEWANDREIRRMAFSSNPIEWTQHIEWFESKLNDPGSLIYIALNDQDEPVAQIIFELKQDRMAIVDVHTKPGLRDQGIGTATILREFSQKSVKGDMVHHLIKERV